MTATELLDAGAAAQAKAIAAGEVSSRELVEATLGRIEALQPRLNAFRVVFAERALAEADQADARRGAGNERPLLGVPVAIKDDVDMAGEVTAWGTSAHGPPKERDAEVVRRLRAAGAVLVGKTNVPEMTIWPFADSMTFGVTRNPWDLERTPGGSSGGTAAAVASGQCGVGLGSDGAGSIRIPAAWCGLFGLKPQRDRVPLSPHDDAWHGMSVNGPLARHVADAALFLDATAGDPPPGGFAQAAAAPPERLRIAVSFKLPPGVIARIGDAQRRAVLETADVLRGLGHEVVERDPDLPRSAWASAVIRYLAGIHTDVMTMPRPERLERRTRSMARMGATVARWLPWARAREAEATAAIDEVLRDCHAILQPGPVAGPFRAGELHGRGALWSLNASAARVPFQGLWNAIGRPAMVVPAGFDADGLPMGVQFGGRDHDEATLLALAAQLESERPWADRRPPVL